MRKLFLAVVAVMVCTAVNAQILNPVKWSYAAKKLNNQEAVIFIKATIDQGWHLYSQNVKDGGPVKTSFKFPASKDYTMVGKTAEPKPVTKFEDAFKMNVSYFENEVIFQQRVKLKKPNAVVKGELEFMVCNDKQCLPPDNVQFSVAVK
ncbi:protein-disulfide reductase DsbD N-terminal domain-containing protein [Mucilaginibacter sp. RS28]|uniref:Protein-disulfide reductase DsbD N-terminal domain-containing protein n=1 Tax=Mucilaginibacter straminoryzae TaxID=2932774 RepID=A0A9X1X6D1_9SPHI|nr:protein-disulfide reductase DsbD domain-containing protein [Mucilaginibacter straminoryzae]MCJ8211748.1 protein-disulfide reductase DsbD N-terminal domain-containing protein [Mucilaginibacter straminoryzae]